MDITSFGILIYSVFTIVAGCLNDNSYEPPELVVVNGLAELVQVLLVKSFEIKLYQNCVTFNRLSLKILQLKDSFSFRLISSSCLLPTYDKGGCMKIVLSTNLEDKS